MKIIYLLLILFITSCATQSYFDQPIAQVESYGVKRNYEAAHAACYRYIYGQGAPLDYDKAFKWCSIAAEDMGASSLTLLAELYYLGNGVPQDKSKSFSLYKQAADMGHMHAQLMVFFHYVSGWGIEQNSRMALHYLNKSVSQGYEKAIIEKENYLAWLEKKSSNQSQ